MTRAFVALLAAVLVAAGCSDDAGDASPPVAAPTVTTMVEGTLTACVAPGPTVTEGADGLGGFDIAVLGAVAQALDLELETASTTIDELVSGVALNGGACDVGAGGVVDGAGLDAVLVTSEPYRTVHRQLVGVVAGPDLALDAPLGRVGVETAGPAAAEASALEDAEVVPFPSRADLGRALEQGAVGLALVTVGDRARIEEQLGVGLVLRGTVPTDEQTVLLLPQDAEEDLVSAVDAALVALREDGTLDALAATWLRG